MVKHHGGNVRFSCVMHGISVQIRGLPKLFFENIVLNEKWRASGWHEETVLKTVRSVKWLRSSNLLPSFCIPLIKWQDAWLQTMISRFESGAGFWKIG